VNCCEVCNVNDDNHNHYYCYYCPAVIKTMTSVITRKKNDDDDDDTCTGCPEDPNKKMRCNGEKITHLDQQQLILETIQLLLHY
jgi:hypothetical protein